MVSLRRPRKYPASMAASAAACVNASCTGDGMSMRRISRRWWTARLRLATSRPRIGGSTTTRSRWAIGSCDAAGGMWVVAMMRVSNRDSGMNGHEHPRRTCGGHHPAWGAASPGGRSRCPDRGRRSGDGGAALVAVALGDLQQLVLDDAGGNRAAAVLDELREHVAQADRPLGAVRRRRRRASARRWPAAACAVELSSVTPGIGALLEVDARCAARRLVGEVADVGDACGPARASRRGAMSAISPPRPPVATMNGSSVTTIDRRRAARARRAPARAP